ncbi:MAG: dihydrofolate synthase / folylpolyglutamate synthase [Gammaproteobacteria bacterium]|nr:dihydrofolate synthase / folylpolyglutamate synthase [Gammaproteobacteria bacterium]
MRTLADWLTLQESVHPKTIDMGLARVTTVARALGVDKPTYRVITVGGTNGKGSTVVHLDALLRAAGASTGMFTSPHFIRYNERIRVAGVEVSDAALVAAFERIESARGTTTLTFFEYNALAALVIFAERAVDVAVLEVGLGGRLDAVNLVDADVAVVCSIGFDHRDWLGDTLDLIGAEKAGIFRSGRPAVLGTEDMPASVYSAIDALQARPVVAGKDFTWRVEDGRAEALLGDVARAHGAQARTDGAPWTYQGLRLSLRDLPPSALAGSIQYRNAATAIAAVEALEMSAGMTGGAESRRQTVTGSARAPLELNERTVCEALRNVRLPGRFQVVPGPVEWILDIAHNEPAAEVFARHVRERAMPPLPQGSPDRRGRTFAVVAILGDKDAKAIACALAPLVDHWIVCTLPGPRGVSAEVLSQRLSLPSGKITLAPSVEAGCEIARATARPGDRVTVFGSVYTVGPALQWLGIY